MDELKVLNSHIYNTYMQHYPAEPAMVQLYETIAEKCRLLLNKSNRQLLWCQLLCSCWLFFFFMQ